MNELLGYVIGYLLSALISLFVLLANTPDPYIRTDPVAYPYSFTDSAKQAYPQTLDGARQFVSDCRELWFHKPNKGARQPEDSYGAMRGDCDDWSVMIAGYLQEFFGYDTVIVVVSLGRVNHACPFVVATSKVVSPTDCASLAATSMIVGGLLYYPIEETPCPGWKWNNPGSPVTAVYEWSTLSGDLYI